MYGPYQHLDLTDFSQPENVERMKESLARVKSEFGKTYQLIIGGQRIAGNGTFNSYNPSGKDEVIGAFQKAQPQHIDQALESGWTAFREWSTMSPEARAAIFLRAAARMKEHRLELAAWEVYEEGKNWVEADADVVEAIDFQEYYAREAIRYEQPQSIHPFPGENNEYIYIPLGVGAIIPPWNFPLAIMSGMTAAAVVAGNCVVLKPSPDSPMLAAKYAEILEEEGLPEGVVNFVTGEDETIGDHLVGHPRTRFISFTGSQAVGLHINELAARPQEGQKFMKRVIAEMGGKDAQIVLADAEVETAAEAAVIGAFGYQGQKCSACSRLIIEEDVYDDVLEQVIKRAKEIVVGPVEKQENWMGPLINAEAEEKVLRYINIGKQEATLVLGGEKIHNQGYFIEPTIFENVKPGSQIEQEEIFGPVLSVIRARDYDHALEIANDTDYGLTGGVFTKDQRKIERAKREFQVGNLYFNRKITGSLVGIQPFGGFKLSGTDAKAGGPDYLLNFLQPKTITQRL